MTMNKLLAFALVIALCVAAWIFAPSVNSAQGVVDWPRAYEMYAR